MAAHVLHTAPWVTVCTVAQESKPGLVVSGMLLLPRNWVSVEVWGKPSQYGSVDGHGACGLCHWCPSLHSLGMTPPLMVCALLC